MYKVYHLSSGHEYFFEERPSKKDLEKVLKDYDEDDKDAEVIKIKVIKNNNLKELLKKERKAIYKELLK